MDQTFNTLNLINAIVYSGVGIILFSMGFWVFDRVTPYHLWKEIIEEKNIALAIMVGAIAIGICQIIASAIHG